MRKHLLAFVVTLAFAGIAQADEPLPPEWTNGPKSNDDACGATLCLLGMSRDEDCNKYVKKYFKIVKFKHGHFSPSRTASARGDFLAQCAEAQDSAKEANDKWGGSHYGF